MLSSEEPLTTTHSTAAEITTPKEETFINENDRSSHVTKIEVYSIGGTILVSLVVAVVIVVTVIVVKYRFRRQPPIQAQENNDEHLLGVIQPGDGTCTCTYTYSAITQ